MQRIALNLIYAGLLIAISPFLLFKAITTGKYRHGWREKLLGYSSPHSDNNDSIWFHAVSVGEVNLLKPVISRLEAQRPEITIVLSTTTKTGSELAAKIFPHLQRFQFPLDFSWAVKRTINSIRPNVLVLAELEIWPNLIAECKSRNVRVGVINARLSENSFRGYQRLKRFLNPVFASLDFVLAQNETYANRFRIMGTRDEVLSITGSVKFDGVETDRSNERTQQLAKLAGITPEDVIFIAGSTQAPEEQHALETYRQLQQQHSAFKLLIVPRHPERFDEVARLLDASEFSWQRRSKLSDNKIQQQTRILLVDTIGELGSWWGTAHIAFVGGSFGDRGGQNMLEPAAFGAAVCFGPNTKNFRDIVTTLLDNDAAVRVNDLNELTHFVSTCLSTPQHIETLGTGSQQVVLSQRGAADKTVKHITQQLATLKEKLRPAA